MHNRQQEYEDNLETERRQESLDRQQFMARHQLSAPDKEFQNLTECVHNLKLCVNNSSWSYCQLCFLLKGQKLRCRFTKRSQTKLIKECICSKDRYHVPLANAIPDVLKSMTPADVHNLRPFEIHDEPYERRQTGELNLRPRPHVYVYVRKCIFLYTFRPSVHT